MYFAHHELKTRILINSQKLIQSPRFQFWKSLISRWYFDDPLSADMNWHLGQMQSSESNSEQIGWAICTNACFWFQRQTI
jgi:hypothetical protein